MSGHSLKGLKEAVPPDAGVKQLQAQVQQQMSVLDNLRYEGEILTDKLIKLRATRHDLEAELFSLKDKRIRLLEVIQHLEDEEMQLVSEVASIIRFKRKVLEAVPHLEARGRTAAGLAVVQDYLLASVQHLQHLAGHEEGDAASIAAAAAAPSWSGTAQVQRPSATWDMQYLPAALAPKASVSTQTDADDLPAAQQMLENLKLVGEPENEQQQQQQQQPELSADPPQQALGYKYRSNPFATVTANQLLQLQSQEGSGSDLPPLPEGQPLSARAASAYSSSFYRSDSQRAVPADSSQRQSTTEPQQQRSGSCGPLQSASHEGSSVLSLGSTASSGSLRRSGSITSRASLGGAVVGSPGGSFSAVSRPPQPSRPSTEDSSSGATSHRQLGRQASGRGLTPSPPPPPPARTRSANLPPVGGLEQGQLSQQLQQLQQQYQQQQQQQQQALLRTQRIQQHQQQQQQQQQQLLSGSNEYRYQTLLAQRQQLQLQHQQQQVLLQQMTGLQGAVGPSGYDQSSAGTLDAASLPSNSTLTSLQSSANLPGAYSGSLSSSAALRGAASVASGDPLWQNLPAGTLVFQGDTGSCDLSQAVAGLPGLLRQQSSFSAGRQSADLMAAAAALGPVGIEQQQQQQLLLDEALEMACVGQDAAGSLGSGLVSRTGSGSGQRLRLQVGGQGPGAAGGGALGSAAAAAAAANLMVLVSPDGSGQTGPGLYLQQHAQQRGNLP